MSTELGITTDVRLEQPEKAIIPIVITESGIITDDRFEQPLNAPRPILITELGITVAEQPITRVLVAVSMMALQSLRES